MDKKMAVMMMALRSNHMLRRMYRANGLVTPMQVSE